jgi:hypothetical protein
MLQALHERLEPDPIDAGDIAEIDDDVVWRSLRGLLKPGGNRRCFLGRESDTELKAGDALAGLWCRWVWRGNVLQITGVGHDHYPER